VLGAARPPFVFSDFDSSSMKGDPGSEQFGSTPPGGGSTPGAVHAPRSGARPTGILPEHLYKAIGLFFVLLVFYNFFSELSRVLLVVYAAAILAVALNVLVSMVPGHRRLVSGALGVLIFGGLGLGIYFAVPALASQLRGFAGEVPRIQEQLEGFGEWIQDQTGLNVEIFGPQTRAFFSEMFTDAEVVGVAVGMIEGIFLPLVIIVGGIYAVAKPNERLLSPLLNAVPRDRRDSFRRLFTLLGTRLKGWVKGTLIGMLLVGTLTAVGLWLLGVQYALLLGVFAALFEIVPILGPWVAGALAVTAAFLDDPSKALWVAILMLAIQQLESNLITPLVMSSVAEVHPFITLFAIFFFGSMFGFLGVILALPLVLLVWTVMEVLWVERAIKAEGDYIEPVVREE
jgi:predicted PurR-regulated permease PerM